MRKAILSLAAAGTAALFATPAAAQYDAPQPPPPPPMPSGTAASGASSEPAPLADVLNAAACSLGRDANAAAALLATTPFSAEERTQAGNFIRTAQRCLRRREPLPTLPYVARGAAAEAAYEAQFATPVTARTPAVAVSPLARPGADMPAETMAVLAPMYGLVDCTTPRQPHLVRALLATAPRSPEEGAAMTAFNPTFVACVPVGTRLTIDHKVMRAFFAESLYRWSVVQRDGPSSPWAAAPPAAAPSGQ